MLYLLQMNFFFRRLQYVKNKFKEFQYYFVGEVTIMKLDIEDNSLRELLQKRKEYIGGSWVGSVGNIIAGISLALTVSYLLQVFRLIG